jgi:hypothetical protein
MPESCFSQQPTTCMPIPGLVVCGHCTEFTRAMIPFPPTFFTTSSRRSLKRLIFYPITNISICFACDDGIPDPDSCRNLQLLLPAMDPQYPRGAVQGARMDYYQPSGSNGSGRGFSSQGSGASTSSYLQPPIAEITERQ